MNLCIDQGNSRIKVALFDGEKITKKLIYKSFSSIDVERLYSLYPIENAIISSVINVEAAIINTLQHLSKKFILFDHHTKIPIVNKYQTPETLGLDRLAAAVGAASLKPNENLLIIDVGSAITFDFVNSQGEYMGGNISPGLKMRLHILKQATKKLPLVETEERELLPLFGQSTREAIATGVVRGITYEVKGYMRTLAERLEQYQTFLTGGNAPYLLTSIGDVHYEKNLVLIGLNQILTKNL